MNGMPGGTIKRRCPILGSANSILLYRLDEFRKTKKEYSELQAIMNFLNKNLKM
jgi:hypothetical protein